MGTTLDIDEVLRRRDKLIAQRKKQSAQFSKWELKAHEMLINAMKARGMSYKSLAQALEKLGVSESPDQLNRKVNRKKFSAAFLLQCLEAMEMPTLQTNPQTTAKNLSDKPQKNGV